MSGAFIQQQAKSQTGFQHIHMNLQQGEQLSLSVPFSSIWNDEIKWNLGEMFVKDENDTSVLTTAGEWVHLSFSLNPSVSFSKISEHRRLYQNQENFIVLLF